MAINKQSRYSLPFFNLLLLAILLASIFISGVTITGAQTIDPTTFRDLTIISGDDTVEAIDGNHNTVWSLPFYCLDKEMLPNGNILITSGRMNRTSSIKIINITTGSVVWEIYNLDGKTLKFTHETDWLGVDQFGQDIFLTADTYNDRVIEFFRNGTVIWSWYAEDHYSYPGAGETDWTHLNDADRLPDGTTMISFRNFNKVAIVNTTATGEILWEYGDYYNDTMLNGPHNPEYTPKGTLLVADSENHRIIEVNMTTKEIIWDYTPTGDDYFGWPRDADLLPNGNILICDSDWEGFGKNRIYEINATTKEIVWYHDTASYNYDADRLDTVLPTANILSPTATEYDGTVAVPIELSCDDPWYDEMVYRIYDETDGEWLTVNNVTYDGETEVSLERHHIYTLHVWAKDLVMEGGAYPTSRAIVQMEETSVQFNTNLDTTAPEISNINVTENTTINFTATVTDDWSGVNKVTLNYTYSDENGTQNNSICMAIIEGNVWSAAIPVFAGNTTVTYTITAEDNYRNEVTTNEMEYTYVYLDSKTSSELPLIPIIAVVAVAVVATLIYRKLIKDKNLS